MSDEERAAMHAVYLAWLNGLVEDAVQGTTSSGWEAAYTAGQEAGYACSVSEYGAVVSAQAAEIARLKTALAGIQMFMDEHVESSTTAVIWSEIHCMIDDALAPVPAEPPHGQRASGD